MIIANQLAHHGLAYEYKKELIPPGGDSVTCGCPTDDHA